MVIWPLHAQSCAAQQISKWRQLASCRAGACSRATSKSEKFTLTNQAEPSCKYEQEVLQMHQISEAHSKYI
jgi:hypothetical protein